MIANLLVILLLVLITLPWATGGKGRGLFSSMLAALCCICAGAIAFGLWEPIVYGVLLGPMEGMEGMAWALGLMIPYMIVLLVLRLLVDNTVKANLEFDDITNFVGGGVFGLVTAVITAGMLAISASFLPLGPAAMGWTPVGYDSGNVVYKSGLWVPVDKITARLYEHLSIGSFSTGAPLAIEQPDVYEQAAMLRNVYVDTDGRKQARSGVLPDQFEATGRYRVDAPLGDLLSDSFNPDKTQVVEYPDGSRPRDGAHIEGYVLVFDGTASERSGQVVVGPAQVRLVVRSRDGDDAMGIHPVAIVAQPEGGGGMYRFRMDAAEIFIASPETGSRFPFAFEFMVPSGWEAESLLVKNVRVPVGSGALREIVPYTRVATRDAGIVDGALFDQFGVSAGGAIDLDESEAEQSGNQMVVVEERLPGQIIINKGLSAGSLRFDQDNKITEGEATFTPEQLRNRGIDSNLRAFRFAPTSKTRIVQVKVADPDRQSILGRAVSRAENVLPPRLIDSDSRSYEAIGFVYIDENKVEIRYTPGRALRGLVEAPALSSAKRGQELYLIFRVPRGTEIDGFALGNKLIAEFTRPVDVK